MNEASGRLGGLAGSLAALLLAAALALLPQIPSADVSGQDIYEYFLDERAGIRVAAALIVIAMLLCAGLFSAIRTRISAAGGRASGGAMFGFSLLAIGGQAFAAATLATLALRPEEADPATSRALLDLAEIAIGVSGLAFALALAACARGIRRAPDAFPPRLALLSRLVAVAVALWGVRLFTDAGAFDAGSFLGSKLGWFALLAWLVGTGLWMLGDREDDPGLPDGSAQKDESQ